MRWLDHFTQDLRYGVRSLLRTPGFAAVAVLTLALGIGANTAIFSVVNAVLLRPLAYKNPDALVTILHDSSNPVAPANYLDWRDQSHSFATMAAAEAWGPNLTGGQAPEHLRGLRMTQNLLPMLGVEPLLGRLFVAGEDEKGREHEVVLGHTLWQRDFSGDPNVLGKAVILNGESYLVVGVMPAQFHFAPFWATQAELWAPMVLSDSRQSRGGNSLCVCKAQARRFPGTGARGDQYSYRSARTTVSGNQSTCHGDTAQRAGGRENRRFAIAAAGCVRICRGDCVRERSAYGAGAYFRSTKGDRSANSAWSFTRSGGTTIPDPESAAGFVGCCWRRPAVAFGAS
jgi:hypothetical protein